MAAGIFSFPRDGPGQRAWHAYFPVGFRELSRAYFILALCRFVLAAPIVLVLNVAGAVLEGHSAREAVVGVAACCPVAFGWYVFGRCLAASGLTNDTANRWVFVCWFMVIALLGALSFIAIAPFGVVRPVSGGVALLLAWAMWRRYAWMLDHGNIDIVG